MQRHTNRRRFKSNSENPSKVLKSPPIVAAIYENAGSSDQYVSDTSKAKRVKFTLPGPTHHPKSDAPKTSEFAFFKKFKEEIGGYHSRPPRHKDGNDQLKTAKANDPTPEISTPSNIFKHAARNPRTSLQSEKERATKQSSFLSTPIGAQSNNIWGLNSRDEFCKMEQRSSLPCANVTPDHENLALSPFASVSNSSGNQYAGQGTFSMKRQKLRELVADKFPVAEDCSSKRFDLVSALISRLFPKINENEYFRHSSSEKGVFDTACQSDILPESDIEGKIRTRTTTGFKYRSSWNDDFPEYFSCNPRERDLSKWDIIPYNVPLMEKEAEIDLLDGEANSNCCLDGKGIKNLFMESDSSCFLPFDYYRSTSFGNPKKLDVFHYLNEPARRGSNTFLVGWDINEEREQDFCSALATPSDVAYEQILDNSRHAITRTTSSFCSNHTVDFHSLPFFDSTGAGKYDLRRIHEDDFAVVETSQFPSFNPTYSPMPEDCDNCKLLEMNNLNLNCQDHNWCTSNACGRNGHLEALVFCRGIDDDLGWKHLPLRELYGDGCSSKNCIFHFPFKEDKFSFALEECSLCRPKPRERILTLCEGAVDKYNWFSTNLHTSLDKLLGLLDNSGRSEEEIRFDDDMEI